MDPSILLVAHFLSVKGAAGLHISVNIDEISSIREIHDFEEGHFGKDISCVLHMTNGKADGSVEPCNAIVRRIFEMSPRDFEKSREWKS